MGSIMVDSASSFARRCSPSPTPTPGGPALQDQKVSPKTKMPTLGRESALGACVGPSRQIRYSPPVSESTSIGGAYQRPSPSSRERRDSRLTPRKGTGHQLRPNSLILRGPDFTSWPIPPSGPSERRHSAVRRGVPAGRPQRSILFTQPMRGGPLCPVQRKSSSKPKHYR